MIWSRGYTASYYAYTIDPVTWREVERIEITGGSINRESSGLRESADIETTTYMSGKEAYIRIYLDARQGGANERVPLFTGLASSPEREFDGNYETNTLQCYSVLKSAEDVLLPRGYYVAAGSSGVTAITDLLSVTPAPYEVNANYTPFLKQSIIAESGESHLSMIEKILAAINWSMRISGDGTILLSPAPTEPVAVMDPLDNDIIEMSVTVSFDWYSTPNVFRAVDDEEYALAKDESPDSPYSTVTRGREVWAEETNCKLNTGESLAQYAIRRLKELQVVYQTASYDRRYMPDVFVDDIVLLHYPAQGLDGLYRVTSQKVELGYAVRTSEEVERA